MSEKTYRAWRPDQVWLLPPSPRDWLSEGHLVDFLMDAVKAIDISPITSYYERELRGFPSFHPRMMLTLQIFSDATGTRSIRDAASANAPSRSSHWARASAELPFAVQRSLVPTARTTRFRHAP